MEAVAVIGLAGSFPASSSIEEFWANLCKGKELISFLDVQELLQEGLDPKILNNPQYVRAKAILPEADCFDASFFGYSAREAAYIDPQQRVLLECAWSALEHSGYDPEQYKGLIGVFAGCSFSSYFCYNLLPHLNGAENLMQDEMLMVMGTEKDFLATRISYKLNLTGPSKCIQTACSSSLVAVHDACQSLLNYECDIALAGGVSITSPLRHGYLYTKEGINSPDGHCRAFDHRAAGTVMGNGTGIVVLKRLNEALADRDTIHALIRGSAINNDGARKVGYTAPSIEGQAQVIIAAQAAAEATPEDITYIEAHGTGTILGDPVEINALTRAFREKTNAKQFCKIGSVKTNIGHLDAAAGIAGLIKTILTVQHRVVPPSLHFEKPNESIAFSESPFIVNDKLTSMDSKNGVNLAGVSSFGIGGTNAHVIVENAPQHKVHPSKRHFHLFPFSGTNVFSLRKVLQRFLEHFALQNFSLADVAYTLQVGRKRLEYRVCFISDNKETLINQINQYLTHGLTNLELIDVSVQGDELDKLRKMGRDWLSGLDCLWKSYYSDESRSRIPLPTYPFERVRHWILPKSCASVDSKEAQESKSDLLINLGSASKSIQSEVVDIWKKSLNVAHIDIQDDFFALGGDSLLALEILDELRKRFAVDLTLSQILEKRTVEQLANVVEEIIIKNISSLSEEEATSLIN